MTEKEKMLKGMIYDCNDEELLALRTKAHNLCYEFNSLKEGDKKREKILAELIPEGNGVYIQGPMYFDYGVFTSFGKGCFANFNFTVLDVCPVKFGDNVYMGPNVSVVTPIHPLLPSERNMYMSEKGYITDKEYAKPITIGSDCWLASGVTVCGGVTIGEGCVIGAGSVVTRDIPAGYFAAGNPCRPIRKITEADSIYLKKGLFEENV